MYNTLRILKTCEDTVPVVRKVTSHKSGIIQCFHRKGPSPLTAFQSHLRSFLPSDPETRKIRTKKASLNCVGTSDPPLPPSPRCTADICESHSVSTLLYSHSLVWRGKWFGITQPLSKNHPSQRERESWLSAVPYGWLQTFLRVILTTWLFDTIFYS